MGKKRTDTLKIVEDKFSTMHGIYFKFADSMIMYMEQPKHSNKTLLGLINQIYKAAVYKTNTQKRVPWLYIGVDLAQHTNLIYNAHK